MPEFLDRLKTALADRYAIEREIGSGGMATVYLAEDLKHHRKVAVKVLRPELAAILGAERFLKEIEVTANLQHPHILPLHDSGEADSFLYYVMPYVEGESLRDKLNRDKQLGVNETVEIAKGVAAGLDYAHRQGVIHRDIKPENILIHDGQPVVSDFGIALAVTTAGGTRLTETGLSLGTPQYMSPEQATGEREVTAKSDVYSLGAVVYEMLVGDPPHTGNTVQAIIAKVVSAEPTPITDVRHNAPGNVDAAVQKALAKVPADRFARATEFAEALGNPAFTLPTSVGTAARQVREGRWKQLAVGFAGIAAVLFGLAVWRFGFSGGGPALVDTGPPAGVFYEAVVDDKPERLPGPYPEYPVSARASRLQGQVLLEFVIDTSGRVIEESIKVLQSLHVAMDSVAMESVRNSLYTPGRILGVPVRVLVTQKIAFTLQRR